MQGQLESQVACFWVLFHIHYIISCFSYAAGNSSNSSNYSTIAGAFPTVISNCTSEYFPLPCTIHRWSKLELKSGIAYFVLERLTMCFFCIDSCTTLQHTLSHNAFQRSHILPPYSPVPSVHSTDRCTDDPLHYIILWSRCFCRMLLVTSLVVEVQCSRHYWCWQ